MSAIRIVMQDLRIAFGKSDRLERRMFTTLSDPSPPSKHRHTHLKKINKTFL